MIWGRPHLWKSPNQSICHVFVVVGTFLLVLNHLWHDWDDKLGVLGSTKPAVANVAQRPTSIFARLYAMDLWRVLGVVEVLVEMKDKAVFCGGHSHGDPWGSMAAMGWCQWHVVGMWWSWWSGTCGCAPPVMWTLALVIPMKTIDMTPQKKP